MKKELANKIIYDDFISKTVLTDNEKDVLMRYIRKDSIVKISSDTKQSTTSVSKVIASTKQKYQSYKKLEIAKLTLLLENK